MATKAIQAGWTKTQKEVFTDAQKTADALAAYAAPQIPALGQGATKEELLEELGPLHSTSKRLEKVINIIKERLKPLCVDKEGKPLKEVTSDNFKREIRSSTRTALNQGAAKVVLEQLNEFEPSRLIAYLQLHKASLPAEVFTKDIEDVNGNVYHESGFLDACMGSTAVEAVYIERL